MYLYQLNLEMAVFIFIFFNFRMMLVAMMRKIQKMDSDGGGILNYVHVDK